MTITTERRDISTIQRGIIAQGVNCQGVMGAGVALALMRKWPQIYKDYISHTNNSHRGNLLGTVQYTTISDDEKSPLLIANCYTQEFYGPGDKRYASPKAILKSLYDVYTTAHKTDGISDVAIPLIGCGLAGLDWTNDVEPIIIALDQEFHWIDTRICLWR